MELHMVLWIVFISTASGISSYPMVSHGPKQSISPNTQQIETGSSCNDIGEILSDDPCRPWCVCKDSVVVCAQIFCNLDVPESCGKIKVNGRCCPTFVCVHANGTASMQYPLPLTVVPPSMYSDDNPKNSKRSMAHRLRLGGEYV